MIFENLIDSSVTAVSAAEALARGAKMLFDHGFVKASYQGAVLEREKNFPTGLMLKNISVAMPHTDSIYVIKPGICIMRMDKPVTFKHMGNSEQPVEVNLIFMMAILNPNAQIDTLKKVVDVFQNCAVIDEFKAAATNEKLYEVAKNYLD